MAKPGVLLKRRVSDQLLTALTILLPLLLFVVAPLQANGVISGTLFGIMFGLMLIPAIVMLSDDRMAVGAILIALILVFVAAVRQGTLLDRYLDAVAWLITGLTLSVVVARAVSGKGYISPSHWWCASVSHHRCYVRGAVWFSCSSCAKSIEQSWNSSGQFWDWQLDLLQLRDFDHDRLW